MFTIRLSTCQSSSSLRSLASPYPLTVSSQFPVSQDGPVWGGVGWGGKKNGEGERPLLSPSSQGRAWVKVSCPRPRPQASRRGNKSTLGSRCLSVLGELEGVTCEETEAANACLDRTKPFLEAEAPFGHSMLVCEHTLGPKTPSLATVRESLIFQASP